MAREMPTKLDLKYSMLCVTSSRFELNMAWPLVRPSLLVNFSTPLLPPSVSSAISSKTFENHVNPQNFPTLSKKQQLLAKKCPITEIVLLKKEFTEVYSTVTQLKARLTLYLNSLNNYLPL